MLDFRLMRIPTFRLSVLCGSLSRIAVGAMPFLLPMMFQLGFGLSAAQSGLITFVSSIGSLGDAPGAPVFLRRLGFRNVLIWIGLVATLLLALSAGVPAELADRRDLRCAAAERVFPVAAVHGLQHHRLCRRAA